MVLFRIHGISKELLSVTEVQNRTEDGVGDVSISLVLPGVKNSLYNFLLMLNSRGKKLCTHKKKIFCCSSAASFNHILKMVVTTSFFSLLK